jgi:hypothetical protein
MICNENDDDAILHNNNKNIATMAISVIVGSCPYI